MSWQASKFSSENDFAILDVTSGGNFPLASWTFMARDGRFGRFRRSDLTRGTREKARAGLIGNRRVSAQIVRRSSRHRSSSTSNHQLLLCLVKFQNLDLDDLRTPLRSICTFPTSITDDRLVHSYSFASSHPRNPSLSHPFVSTTSNALQLLTKETITTNP